MTCKPAIIQSPRLEYLSKHELLKIRPLGSCRGGGPETWRLPFVGGNHDNNNNNDNHNSNNTNNDNTYIYIYIYIYIHE